MLPPGATARVGRGGHSAHRGEVGGPVVAQDLPGLLPGVEPRQQIQNCQPEVVSHHHDQDHDEEDGQLGGVMLPS